jgi:tetratricopeptide (TPR) repeat protein
VPEPPQTGDVFPELAEAFPAAAPVAPPGPAAGDDFADAWGAAPDPLPGSSASFGEVDLAGGDANATDFPIPDDFEPAQPGGFAWDQAAAPVAAAPAAPAGTGGRAAPPSAPAVDPLEFDPSAPPQDDLEADLSAPLPRAPAPEPEPEDGLEMLGFLEEASKETKGKRIAVARFHVRRRSGKVFGPFDEGVIAKMLADGQLLGNEDVSLDQETWAPLGSVPGFAHVMQKLLTRPDAPVAPPTASGPPVIAESSPADLDRLRQVYEGRMAVVSSMVDSEVWRTRRRRLLKGGAIALGVLLLVAAGASLGFTRYGPFASRWLFPPRVSAGSPEAKRLADARAAMAQDTFASLKAARAQLEQLLATREIPEVRATWVQALSRLQRQYSTTAPGDAAAVALAFDGDLGLMARRDIERIKASASAALAARQVDRALAELAEARSSDAELILLRADAAMAKNQPKAAVELLEPLSKSAPSARVWHALGMARVAAGDVTGGDAALAKALEADPKHVSSALERASLALVGRHDAAATLAALGPMLEPVAFTTLSPAEQARALTLQGMALLEQGDGGRGLEVLERAVKADPVAGAARGALARAYLAKHDLEAALPLLTDAVQKEPQNTVLAEMLVNTLLALGRPQDAQLAVASALSQSPGNARLLLLSGQVNESLDRLSEAEAQYKAALAADPTQPDAALALGRFFLRFRRTAEARAQFDALAQRLPDDARVRVGLGDLAMADGDISRARVEFEKAAALDPKSATAWLGQSRVAVEQQRWTDALADADRALALEANVADGRLQRGLALWKLKDLTGALKEMDAARTTSGNLKVNIAVGGVLLDKGDQAGAEAVLNQALKVEPSNPEANFYMALVHAARSEWASAIESMRAALDRVPGRASYHYELGRIYREAKKVPEAIEEWKICVKLNPRHADAQAAIGEAYQDAQRYDDAILAYEAALKADPSRGALLVAVGDCYAQTNHWADAVLRYQQALRTDPKLTGVYYRIARAYTEQNDQTKAVPFYVKATVAEPQNALAFYHLGYAYKERGRRREAVAAFRAFLQKSPNAKERQEVEDEVLDLSGGR